MSPLNVLLFRQKINIIFDVVRSCFVLLFNLFPLSQI